MNTRTPNLKRVKRGNRLYYYYRLPNGHLQALGKITDQAHTITDQAHTITEQAAIDAAQALNASLHSPGSALHQMLCDAHAARAPYNPRNPPMLQVIDEYRQNQLQHEHQRGRLSDQTLAAKQLLLREYEHLLGNTPCQAVTPFDLAQHLKHRSGHVQHKHLPLLRKLFRYAIGQGYCTTNPARELDAKAPEQRQRQRHSWHGYQRIHASAPAWLQRAMDIALYSLQRRSDLLQLHSSHINRPQRTLNILQQKTRNYAKPVYLQIHAGDALWQAINAALTSDIPCPYLIHCRPARQRASHRNNRPHPFAVHPDYLTRHYSHWRDASGAYNHLPRHQRPSFHDIRALGILMYHKAGYPMDYIMALAGHARSRTTEHYIDGHEHPTPLAVNAGLSLHDVALDTINWKTSQLPSDLAQLLEP